MAIPLVDYRRLVGASLEDVARATGLNSSTINRIERGEIGGTAATHRKILQWADEEARRLDLPPSKRLHGALVIESRS